MNAPHTSKDLDPQDRSSDGIPTQKMGGRVVPTALAICMMGALGMGGWYYRHSRLGEVPPPPNVQSQAARPIAAIAVDASAKPANGPVAEVPPAAQQQETIPEVKITVNPMDRFREDLKRDLRKHLVPTYPRLPDLSSEAGSRWDRSFRDSVFQFLEGAEKAPEADKPAMLLAADFMLQALWCRAEQKDKCDNLPDQFAEHKLTLAYSELGGGSYYQHDLLWRISNEYSGTDWGERAFVLLLDSGLDTSGTCAKPGDPFRRVIAQGEPFLEQHPNSPYRGYVTHLVGQGYAAWWSLSSDSPGPLVDYVDPKQYKEGSEQARLKAIDYFEQVLQQSPETQLGEYAREVLPALRERQLTSDRTRFFCVYD